MAAIAKGYRISQIPVTFHPRQAGQSFIRSPLTFSLQALPDLPRAWVEFRRLRRESRAIVAARGEHGVMSEAEGRGQRPRLQ